MARMTIRLGRSDISAALGGSRRPAVSGAGRRHPLPEDLHQRDLVRLLASLVSDKTGPHLRLVASR